MYSIFKHSLVPDGEHKMHPLRYPQLQATTEHPSDSWRSVLARRAGGLHNDLRPRM
jgi:hypothetical protein